MDEYGLPEKVWRELEEYELHDHRIAEELDIYSSPVDELIKNDGDFT